MAILKKITAATLMETLVATALLVLIFMVASLTMNTLFGNTIVYNAQPINTYLNELEYRYENHNLQLPYVTTYQNWNITIYHHIAYDIGYVAFEAIHERSHKTISKIRMANGKAL